MIIGDWKSVAGMAEHYRKLRELGLESSIAELGAFGFTVVPPEKTGVSPGLIAAMADALREEAHSGREKAVAKGEAGTHPGNAEGEGAYSLQPPHLLKAQPLFLEPVINPVALSFAKYLMGNSCLLYTVTGFPKEGRVKSSSLHCDSRGMPPPLPFFSNVVNISWLLTDYTVENGTFCFVPGSHQFCRHPMDYEQPKFMGGTWDDDMCVPVIAPAGSLIIFPSNTWHGTYPKTNDAFRAHVAIAYRRNYMGARQHYGDLDADLVAKGGPEFERLIGRRSWQGVVDDHPEFISDVLAAQTSIYG